MIENYTDKKKKKLVDFAFAESGAIAVLERKFDSETGVPLMLPVTETSTAHIDKLLDDLRIEAKPILDRIANLEAMRPDVEKKENEREKLIKSKAGEKAK